MGSAQRDLASRDVWSHSLERSHERRVRAGVRPPVTAAEMLPPRPRDLTDPEVWQRSRWRANARREAAATDFELRTPSPRGLSLAALFAIVGVPVASLGAGLADAPEAEAKPRVASKGGGVRKLQRALGIGVDGIFGPQTKRALKRWQRAHGLVADGIAGPATRAALGIGAGAVLKRKGGGGGGKARTRNASSRGGGGVAAMQRALGIPSDGVFGPQTESALKRWQARHGLVADGVAGPATRRALGLGPGRMLKRGGKAAEAARNSIVQRVIAAGNRIAHKPYKYGGGHGSFRDSGYDCSGSVSYALRGGGLLKRAARLRRLHLVRQAGTRQAHHDLRELRPRLHDGQRPPVRHQRHPHQRLALDRRWRVRAPATWSRHPAGL